MDFLSCHQMLMKQWGTIFIHLCFLHKYSK
jgi:cbb3-type cytochrome oxidase subunit 3